MAADDSLENQPLSEAEKQMLKIGRELAEDPKTRNAYLRLIKEKYPSQPIPELDTLEQMRQFAAPALKELADLKKERLAEKVEREIEQRRAELRAEGMSADDIKAIEEMMVKEQIPNHKTAANYYKLSRTAAQPTPASVSSRPTLPVDKKSIKDAGGIKNWARDEAGRAFDDIKSGRVKLH